MGTPYETIQNVAEPVVAGLLEACTHSSVAGDLPPDRVFSVVLWGLAMQALTWGCSRKDVVDELRRAADSIGNPIELPPGMTAAALAAWLNNLEKTWEPGL